MKASIVNPVQIEKATAKIICGDEYGTGFLISEDTLITAHHVVLNHIEEKNDIKIKLRDEQGSVELNGSLFGYDEELDIAIIKLETSFKTFLSLKLIEIRYGSEWDTYGFPHEATNGSWFKGVVKQHNQFKPYDIELQYNNYNSDTDYSGLSGSALTIENKVVGVLTWNIADGFGAISISKIESFLISKKVEFERERNADELPDELIDELDDIASIQDVIRTLQSKLKAGGQYYLLYGSPGSGKTIVSASLSISKAESEIIGKYFIGRPNDQRPRSKVISKESFIGWLEDLISKKLSGKAYPKQTGNFNDRIEAFEGLLEGLNQYYLSKKKIGIILIDGLDEVVNTRNVDLEEYLGVFPETLPSNISILLSATREELLPSFIKSELPDNNKTPITPIPLEFRVNFIRRYLENREITLSIENIHIIAEKSEGHPLYLRYLLEELKREEVSDISNWLNGLPKLEGDISNYYEKIWNIDLVNDPDKFWIILTISQLRHSVNSELLIKMLPEDTRQTFSSKKESIRHLFRDDSRISIYHNSFTSFLETKASESISIAHDSITSFCQENEDLEYSVANRIFHHLNSTNSQQAVIDCNQEWADKCAFISVEPDLVLKDISDVEIHCIESGFITELIRIKLLLQRIRFRYDNVLALNAFHIANLLIELSQPENALKYILRGGLLLVQDEDAIYFLQRFYESEALEEADKLQTAIRKRYQFLIEKELQGNGFKFTTILLHLKSATLLLNDDIEQAAGEFDSRMKLLTKLKNADERNHEEITHLREYASAWNMGYIIWRFDRYPGLLAVQRLTNVDIDEKWTRHFAMMSAFYDMFKKNMHFSDDSSTYWELVKDIEHLAEYYGVADDDLPIVISALIEDSKRVDIATDLISRLELNSEFILRTDNGVDVNFKAINLAIEDCKYIGYLNTQVALPEVEYFSSYNWERNIREMVRFLGMLFGRAYKLQAENETEPLISLEQKVDELIEKLDFTLYERAQWDRSYAIPEATLPRVYGLLMEFILKFFPDKTTSFIDRIIERGLADQLGLYTEGYRQSLYSIAEEISRYPDYYSINNKIISTLEEHVTVAVQNRWERVPELLQLAELYSRIGNNDKAEAVFRMMLDSSMGPTWYKEDQFTLINSVLFFDSIKNISVTHFKEFAGYLDFASGELTFQRFVRYAKESLINNLVNAGHISLAIQYFKYQVLPDPSTVIENAESSTVDAVDKGQGYNLGARSIIEAGGIVQLLKNIEADPMVIWGIAEAFVINDDIFRYVRSFSKIQSQCISHSSLNIQEKEILHNRLLKIITDEDIGDNQANYLEELKECLDEEDRKILQGNLIKEGIEFDFPQKPEKSFKREELSEEEINKYDDFRLPGMGKNFHDDLKNLEECLVEANIEIDAENLSKAREILVNGLLQLHTHETDIWQGNMSSEVSEAFELLTKIGDSATTIRMLKKAISNHITSDWMVADSLIEILNGNLSEEETKELIDAAKAHINTMIQCDDKTVEKYSWVANVKDANDVNTLLIEFLIWLLNHPHNSVKLRVIESLRFLSHTRPDLTIPVLFNAALSEKPEFSSELAAYILNEVGGESPNIIWDYLNDKKALHKKISQVEHFSIRHYFKELVTSIITISAEAKDLYTELADKIPSAIILEGRIEIEDPSLWSAMDLLEELNDLQILNISFYETLVKKVKTYSKPLEPIDQVKVQRYIQRSFYDQDVHFGSYDYLLRYAINISITDRVSKNDYHEVTDILSLPVIQ